MSGPDYRAIATDMLGHVVAAQGGLRFEVLRSGRDGMRAQLLNALGGLSEAEGILLEAIRDSSTADWDHMFDTVQKWVQQALTMVEGYYDALVEAPGIGTHLGICLELPEKSASTPTEGASS